MSEKIEQILARATANNWFAVFSSDEAKELSDKLELIAALRDRCIELESRLDIGTGNMYDVVVVENERLRERCAELLAQCNTNYEPLRKQLEEQGLAQAGVEYAYTIELERLAAENAQLAARVRELTEALSKVADIFDIWECECTLSESEAEVYGLVCAVLPTPPQEAE